MIEDLSLDDDDSKPPPGAAMTLREKVTPAELLVMCAQHRAGGRKEFAGAGVVLFLRDDEEIGEVVWDDQAEITKWRKLMGWPRDPTIEEVKAWKANAEARLEVAFWDRRQAARSGGP